jgi:hypothetical protein
VQLYTDIVPNKFYSPEDRARFGSSTERQKADATEVNRPFQQNVFGTSELPLYVILEPNLDGTINVVKTFHGLIRSEEAFASFLRPPQSAGGGAVAQAKPN